MTVTFSPAAKQSLNQIWDHNAREHDADHADRYIAFLRYGLDHLTTDHRQGKPVPGSPTTRYVIFRRRLKGHGHVAVYEFVNETIYVVNLYHTAQDWPTRLAHDHP